MSADIYAFCNAIYKKKKSERKMGNEKAKSERKMGNEKAKISKSI